MVLKVTTRSDPATPSHAALTEWGLKSIPIKRDAFILDVGCGGGKTVQRLAALAPDGKVVGWDYSATSIGVARATNALEIASGGVTIQQGSVVALPFQDGTFDIVTAVETHYYWPNLPANFQEILRVLKPGGTFALIAETYRGGHLGKVYGMVMPLLHATFLTDGEHRNLLRQAGFVEVATAHVPWKSWMCATGRRPL